jgi:hypothetical protein
MPLADDVKTKLEAGRTEIVQALRTLADQLEALDLEDVGESLSWWIEPHLRKLREGVERILRRG